MTTWFVYAVIVWMTYTPLATSPPMLRFANFEQNARPSTNVEDFRPACSVEAASHDECFTTVAARVHINVALDNVVAVDNAVDSLVEIWPEK